MVLLYDPSAPVREERTEKPHPALGSLTGKAVGFIDNAKPNFDHLVADLGDLLTTKYGVSRVITCRKTSASVPAPAEMVETLTAQCDVVIAGSGD